MSDSENRDTPLRIGCVSYLNAKPLIHGLEGLDDVPGEYETGLSHEDQPDRQPIRPTPPTVGYEVPSRLLDGLDQGRFDLALSPVIDYHRAKERLRIVPVGGIGCEGPTLTVRLFSRVPIEQLTHIHADTDSHTSVALLQVLLNRLYGIQPRLIDRDQSQGIAGQRTAGTEQSADHAMEPNRGTELGGKPERGLAGEARAEDGLSERGKDAGATMGTLLIGDKVVTQSPPADDYPHQLDLGQAWNQLTGLPFVFAVWMGPTRIDLGNLPERLAALREKNLGRVTQIAEHYAPAHGWPTDLARRYLGQILQYRITPRHVEAIERFAHWAAEDGLIDSPRTLTMSGDAVP